MFSLNEFSFKCFYSDCIELSLTCAYLLSLNSPLRENMFWISALWINFIRNHSQLIFFSFIASESTEWKVKCWLSAVLRTWLVVSICSVSFLSDKHKAEITAATEERQKTGEHFSTAAVIFTQCIKKDYDGGTKSALHHLFSKLIEKSGIYNCSHLNYKTTVCFNERFREC